MDKYPSRGTCLRHFFEKIRFSQWAHSPKSTLRLKLTHLRHPLLSITRQPPTHLEDTDTIQEIHHLRRPRVRQVHPNLDFPDDYLVLPLLLVAVLLRTGHLDRVLFRG